MKKALFKIFFLLSILLPCKQVQCADSSVDIATIALRIPKALKELTLQVDPVSIKTLGFTGAGLALSGVGAHALYTAHKNKNCQQTLFERYGFGYFNLACGLLLIGASNQLSKI